MKAKLLMLSFIFAFAFVGSAYAQSVAQDGYDRTGFEEPGQLAGTSLVQDLDEIKKRAINNIIQRIRKGDPNVLKYVVYDVFTEVHKAILQESREMAAKSGNALGSSYYDVVGGKAALPAFYGCFDNQDPKVRLRCIGFLGDWIDDMGISLADIGRQAQDRLHSNIETRVEVRYGLILLTLKVYRKIVLNNIWKGDEDELKNISPQEFVVLVHNEPFIREMFCIPRDVKLRSIRLLPWWLQFYENSLGGAFWYRTSGAEDQERIRTNTATPFRNLAKELDYRIKVNDQFLIYRNYGGEPAKILDPGANRKTQGYGYKDPGGYLDIVSLYDLRYFRYSDQKTLKEYPNGFQNEEKYLKAIFAGLANNSLFVRENVARMLVRLTDGPVGFTMRGAAANYDNVKLDGAGNTGFTPWADVNATQRSGTRAATPFEILDDTNSVVGVEGMLSRLGKNATYQSVLRNAWENVRFAQFMDVHEYARPDETAVFATMKTYDPNEGINLNRNVIFSDTANRWGYKYNYRTDIADLMRRFGLGRELEFCDRKRIEAPAQAPTGGHYFVEDLFDLDEQSVFAFPGSNVQIPLWHGKDVIKDEVFEP
jgi:hypothetical protein